MNDVMLAVEALVPPLATAKVPVMSAVRLTAPNVGAPAALPCRTVVVVPRLASGAGAAPAPPPKTIALAVNAPEVAQVVPLEKYGMPPDVPAIVNAGVVVGLATETMPPVHPTLVTVPLVAGAAQDGAPPVVAVNTCPVVPAAVATGELPAPPP